MKSTNLSRISCYSSELEMANPVDTMLIILGDRSIISLLSDQSPNRCTSVSVF